jgi:IclR family transcriptional regulator, KDG regulon repressor
MRTVPALSRGLGILTLLSERGASRVSEIARVMAVPRSAAYELIHTLMAHEAVQMSADGRVTLSHQAFIWGGAYARSLDFWSVAQEAAQQLMSSCLETVQVGTLVGRHVLYVLKADSPQPLRLVSNIGSRLPAHCTALGKVLLAFLQEDELSRRLHGVTLERLTKRSISDRRALSKSLAQVRRQGYASEYCESNVDVACVSAPIWNQHGENIAAISISTPAARWDQRRQEELRTEVVESARRLSLSLGFSARAINRLALPFPTAIPATKTGMTGRRPPVKRGLKTG